jgi:carbonic anhydrase/acetyltransferase-like protein (isoleucine patch superfamily)
VEVQSVNIRAYRGVVPKLGARVYVDPDACVIGDVTLGEDASIWPKAVLRGDVNRIVVGARSNVQDGSVLHVTHDGPYSPGGLALTVGAEVTVGHGVMLHACTVGDRCLIGIGAIVLDGVVLEPEVQIGAGSVLAPGTRARSHTLWLGNPAKCARDLTTREIENLAYLAAHYVRVKNGYQ